MLEPNPKKLLTPPQVANVYTGSSGDLGQKSFAIIVSTYHHAITEKLLGGAVETLVENGTASENISVLHVPGAWEISLTAATLIKHSPPDGIVCLGCVIRGETTHDQHINTAVSNQLAQMSCDSGVPVAFGLLTCNSMDQAIARSGGDVGNKGVECADAIIHMVRLFEELGAARKTTSATAE